MTAGVPINETQQALFDAVANGKTEEALKIINSGTNIVCYDSSKMTPLSAAAYRGNYEVAEACLKRGLNVNDREHDHGYTPLMFAALAGKPELCKLLMDYGAKSYLTNKIGKTASELAAFVGQHECVSIINNHISIDEIDKFLHPRGEESEERFPEELVHFIHDVCKSHRVHPVGLIFHFVDYNDAMVYKKKILYVIDRIFEKQLRNKETNEVMSLKLWIILFIMRELIKYVEQKADKDPKEVALNYAKFLLQWSSGQHVRPELELLLRNAVRAFPYHQSLLFETMVKAMAKVEMGERPSAFEFIVQGLFGQRLLACSHFCATCGAFSADKRCPSCKLHYCSQKCQKFDWPVHKKICTWLKTQVVENEEASLSIDDIQAQISQIDV